MVKLVCLVYKKNLFWIYFSKLKKIKYVKNRYTFLENLDKLFNEVFCEFFGLQLAYCPGEPKNSLYFVNKLVKKHLFNKWKRKPKWIKKYWKDLNERENRKGSKEEREPKVNRLNGKMGPKEV